LADFSFFFLIGTFFSYGLTRAVIAATILDVPQMETFALCAFSTVLLFALFYNRRTFFILMGVLTVAILGVVFYLRMNGFNVGWYQSLRAYIAELVLFFDYKLPYDTRYAGAVGAGLALMMTFLSALNIRICFSFFTPALLALSVVGVPTYMQWGTDPQAVRIIIFCLLVLLVKRLNLFTVSKEKGRMKQSPAYIMLLFPVCLALFAVSWMLPKPDIDAAALTVPFEFSGRGGGLLNITTQRAAAFSGDGSRLGGPMRLGDEYVMEVESEEPVYLSGRVSDTYTGMAWTSDVGENGVLSAGEDGRYVTTDYAADVRRAQRYFMRYYDMKEKSVTIRVGDAGTSTVFTPPFPQDLWISDILALRRDGEGVILADKTLARDTYYTQQYIAWDYASPYFQNILAGSAEAARSGADMARYLSLPTALPQRVRDLTGELTAGLSGSYEKIKALERYLSRFPYTTDPGHVPPEADFVDYFLFEGREGYCVYYATALAVMGRCAGVPTRYVEGFVTPRERNGNGHFTVTNQQAHAWVQAYFPGFGWMNFEPTAPFYTSMYEAGENSEFSDMERVYPDYFMDEELTEDDYYTNEMMLEMARMNEQEGTAGMPDIDMKRVVRAVLGGFLIASLLAACFVGLMVWRYNAGLKKVDTLSGNAAVIDYFTRIVGAVSQLGLPMYDNETAYAYAYRAEGTKIFTGTGLRANALADIFSRACYGPADIDTEEREAVRRCYTALVDQLRRPFNHWPRYIINRYILARY
jgi:transglutaminase-like putative cysteine protease